MVIAMVTVQTARRIMDIVTGDGIMVMVIITAVFSVVTRAAVDQIKINRWLRVAYLTQSLTMRRLSGIIML